ncbi:MAG: pantoate--beta-alanine ligase [Thermoguttaceae bacterium]|jgi:pantoate--beta-alanine ligase
MTSYPQLISSIAELHKVLSALRKAGKRIGLVPTMGALHEGHLSLVRASKAQCDCTVVSIYVNPSQFGPREDLAKYPRTLPADLEVLAALDTELVFTPGDEEMYPSGYCTWVEVGTVAEPLEGQCRSGHFRGVATIVLKLFEIVRPAAAFFGQKDFQQALVIRRMVKDLHVPIEIRLCPTMREPDGLAMSSRNRYLSPAARQRALVLWKSLKLAEDLLAQGERSAEKIVDQMRKVIITAEDARIDYVALVDPETLLPIHTVAGRTLAALAVKIENTRLIDNCLLEV